jgi:ferric-dicitrate binding protein FerR (iron transport regulator)
LKELELLIREHPEWQHAVQNIGDVWTSRESIDYLEAEDAFMLHQQRMKELNIDMGDGVSYVSDRKTKNIRWYWAAAAAAIIGGFFLFNSITEMRSGDGTGKGLAREVNEISTRPGSKSKIELPDGSIVWLNAGSKLTYDKNFGKELREVTLTGEGYFDVMKMKEKPFIIHTSSINIKVLGTVFNVKAYPEDKHTETSLIRGSVEVTIKNRPNDKIILSPSEKLIVENDAIIKKGKEKENNENTSAAAIKTLMSVNKLKYSPVDSTVAETEWIKNRLVFRDESLAELAVRMERWFNVTIEITDETLQQKRVTGIFENETIDQALGALKISIPFKYDQTVNKIIIHR